MCIYNEQFIVLDIVQDIAEHIKKLLGVDQIHLSVHTFKNHFCYSLAFDVPKVWNNLPDERYAPTVCLFQEKLKSYLFKKGSPPPPPPPPLAYKLTGVSMVSTWICQIMITELVSGIAP